MGSCWDDDTVDGSEVRQTHQLRLVVYTMIYRISSINSIFRLVNISRYFFGSGSNGEMEIEFIEFYKKKPCSFSELVMFFGNFRKFQTCSKLSQLLILSCEVASNSIGT